MTYCLLFQLPRDLYNCICSDWLGIRDIVLLDCAVSPNYRDIWNVQLASKSMFSDEMEYEDFFNELSVGGWNWMYQRNVTIKALSLREKLFDTDGQILINLRTDQVESCEVRYVYFDISDLINSCAKLRTLELSHFDEGLLEKLNPAIVEQLTTLALDINEVKPVLFMCRNLIELQLDSQLTCDTFRKLSELNPFLKAIRCKGDEKLLETIFSFKLKEVTVIVKSEFPVDFIMKTVHQWNQFTTFRVELDSEDEIFEYDAFDDTKILEVVLKSDAHSVLCNAVQGLTEADFICVPDDAVKEMLVHSRQTLTELRLRMCSLEKDTFLSIFSCPNLIRCIIGLIDCQEVMEYMLINIKPQPQPQQLKVLLIPLTGHCEQMVIQIIETFPTLKLLEILKIQFGSEANYDLLKEYLKIIRAKGREIEVSVFDNYY